MLATTSSMSLEENKAIIRKIVEAINKQNLASKDELMAPDFVLHMHAFVV